MVVGSIPTAGKKKLKNFFFYFGFHGEEKISSLFPLTRPEQTGWRAGVPRPRSPRLSPCSRIRGDGRGPQTLVIGGLGFIPAGGISKIWTDALLFHGEFFVLPSN